MDSLYIGMLPGGLPDFFTSCPGCQRLKVPIGFQALAVASEEVKARSKPGLTSSGAAPARSKLIPLALAGLCSAERC
jgi:hypothetical protein